MLKRDDWLVGFLEHDTVGLLVPADRDDSIGERARNLQAAAPRPLGRVDVRRRTPA